MKNADSTPESYHTRQFMEKMCRHRNVGYFAKTAGRLAFFAASILWAIHGDAGQSHAVPPEASNRATQSSLGDETPAAIFSEAVAAAREIKTAEFAGGILCDIAGSQASAGLFADALATARTIQHRGSKVVALQWVAGAQCNAGFLTDALSTAREIDVPRFTSAENEAANRGDHAAVSAESNQQHAASRQAMVLGMIAAAQAKARQVDLARRTLEEALATAERIKGPARASAVCDVAATQAKAKLVDQTRLACARAIAATKPVYENTLKEVAESQMRVGLFMEALDTARKISGGKKLLALCQIAVAQAKAGQPAPARNTLAEAFRMADGETQWKDRMLCFVSRAQVEAGFFADALATAVQIDRSEGKAITLKKLAESQVKAGLLIEALATARHIDGDNRIAITIKGSILGRIAVAQAKAGQSEQARQTFVDALTTAQQSEDVSTRVWVLCEVSTAQAEAKQVEQARRTFVEALAVARGIGDQDSRAWMFCAIAAAQAKAGMKDQANSTLADAFTSARAIKDADQKGEKLSEIVTSQVEAGLFAEAIVTVRENADYYSGHYPPVGLREVAVGQIKAGQVDQARQTFAEAIAAARATGNPQGATAQIAVCQAKAGLIAEALTTAREITKAREKAKALCGIGAARANEKKKK